MTAHPLIGKRKRNPSLNVRRKDSSTHWEAQRRRGQLRDPHLAPPVERVVEYERPVTALAQEQEVRVKREARLAELRIFRDVDQAREWLGLSNAFEDLAGSGGA